jgi:tryptophanyl-tRNA synthetase
MKRLLSGITPSGDGNLHIGNYLGAVKQFIDLSRDYECFLMFADLHALTTVQDKKTLQKNTESLILNEIALVGESPNVYFFRQSDVPMHTELTWIFNTLTSIGVLKRAHAYKDKLAKDVMEDEISLGLFTYPVLMASDILLYKPDVVPVGKDQKQHVEIARDIAEKFNKTYEKVFPLPEPLIPEDVAVILGIDGKRKMSKSLGNIISIFDDEDVIRKQVNSCFTDPARKHATDPGHIEGNMVFAYLKHFGEPAIVKAMAEKYEEGKIADVEVKEYLCESLLNYFAPARKRYQELKENSKKVKEILEKGTARARRVAQETIAQVRDAVGLKNIYSVKQHFSSNEQNEYITLDEFYRVKERVGRVVNATYPKNSEKLIRLEVDFGDEKRVIFTGVRGFGYTKEDFIGKQFFFVTNLAPRKMMGEESQGMILAVDLPAKDIKGDNGKPMFISAEGMPLGAIIK